jgi:hypothetical protein
MTAKGEESCSSSSRSVWILILKGGEAEQGHWSLVEVNDIWIWMQLKLWGLEWREGEPSKDINVLSQKISYGLNEKRHTWLYIPLAVVNWWLVRKRANTEGEA